MDTSLYRCEDCGNVVRYKGGATDLAHLCQAFDSNGNYRGKGSESRYVAIDDDGRDADIAEDIRPGVGTGVWVG